MSTEESKMSLTDVVMKLVGQIAPIGETNEDARRYENLLTIITLVENLMSEIDSVSSHHDDYRYSMSRAGKCAKNFIKNLTDNYRVYE